MVYSGMKKSKEKHLATTAGTMATATAADAPSEGEQGSIEPNQTTPQKTQQNGGQDHTTKRFLADENQTSDDDTDGQEWNTI